MGEQARQQVVQCGQAFARRDVAMAQDLVRQDDVIDGSTARSSTCALELGDDVDRREWAMHMMLVARCIERIGDMPWTSASRRRSSSPPSGVRGRLAPLAAPPA